MTNSKYNRVDNADPFLGDLVPPQSIEYFGPIHRGLEKEDSNGFLVFEHDTEIMRLPEK